MKEPGAKELGREALVEASFAVLDDAGLAGLTMRRVAAHLGVQAPAIYWHVNDKAALLGLMARDIYAKAYAAVPEVEDWREWLRALGYALRDTFAQHRDGAHLCAIAKPTDTTPANQAVRIAAPLVRLGLEQDRALQLQAAVISYALGWAMFEANGPMHTFLDEIMNFKGNFQIGLEAIVAGLNR